MVVHTNVSLEEAKRRTERVLKAIGKVDKVDASTASGVVSTLGRRTNMTIRWLESEGKVDLEITTFTVEFGDFATRSAINRFVDTFINMDKPGFFPDDGGVDEIPQELVVFGVFFYIALIVIAGVVFVVFQNKQ